MKERYRLSAGFLALSWCVASSQAFAQTSAESDATNPSRSDPSVQTGIADIVVTAERREQSAQKAPLTIQVVGSEELARAGLTEVTGLQRVTTGVEIGRGGANTQIFIRGVGGAAFNPLSSPGVAFNVDGVYVGRPNGVNGNFYDVARVEVLKGPQGTLYGRNANGGSINLITNVPSLGERTSDLGLEVGNYGLVRATGSVNLPVSDTVAVRGAFNIVNRDGFISNGTDDDVQQSGRVRLFWEPSTDVRLLLNADYSHFGGKGGDFVYLPRRPGASPYEAQSEPAANAYMRAFGPLGPLIDDQRDDNRQDTHLFNVSAQLDWDLGDFATFTLLPAYRHVDTEYVTHFATRLSADETTEQFSVEARLGNSTPGLTWVLGAYYFDERSPDSISNVFASNILQNYLIEYSPETKAYAAFGQATVEVVDRLRLIAGGRYTYEKRALSGSITNLAIDPPALLEAFGGRKSFDGFTYRVGAEYDLSPRNLLFLTYSTGFKAGGFSQTIAPANVFQPERLKSLEFGSRNRFLDNRLQVNFGAFRWKYSDIQDQRINFDPLNNVNFITFNSGDATLYGGTLDVVAKPTARDTISLSGEYIHSEYDRFFFQTPVPFLQPGSSGCALSGPFAPGATLPYSSMGSNTNTGPLPVIVGDCRGFQVARVPEWSGTLAYSREFPVANGGSIVFDGLVKYSSARWLSIDFIPAERDGAYATADATLTYTNPEGDLSLALFGRNLTKSVYYTGALQTAFIGGLVAANIAPPRTYGVRLTARLGK
ncbi:TonB-dependent receptor [uncultured Sphingomonas sp.]|uniref:TonB-dependent receptor n=1 Tax=uncultured Sphingomonas sp. TaxID=158754 RepID=UPI0035C9D49B